MEEFGGLYDLNIIKKWGFARKIAVEEFTEVVVCIFYWDLWMGESQLSRGSEQLSRHQGSLHEFMQIFSFINQFCQLAKNNTTNKNISRAKCIS